MSRRAVALAGFVVIGCSACGGGVAPSASSQPSSATAPSNVPSATAAPRCTDNADARALLDEHARAFGTASALDAELPLTIRMDEALEGKTGAAELVLDKRMHRLDESVAGIRHAAGIDAKGPWLLDVAGVPMRLERDEATAIAFDEWILPVRLSSPPLRALTGGARRRGTRLGLRPIETACACLSRSKSSTARGIAPRFTCATSPQARSVTASTLPRPPRIAWRRPSRSSRSRGRRQASCACR